MAKTDPNAEALARVPIFRNLSAKPLAELSEIAKERSFATGAVVLREGDAGVGLFILLDGNVEVRRGGNVVARFGPGQFFGEMTLLDQQPRSADVVALGPTRCLVLSSWEFWGWAADKPDLLRGMLTEMARRLREADKALTA